MNKKILSIVIVAMLVVGGTAVFASSNGEDAGEQYRVKSENFVERINKIADEDDEIGEEIKSIVEEEKNNIESISEKVEKIEQRSGFKTFFIGSDYKNLGALRSELVTTQNHINRFTRASIRATSTTTQAELAKQVVELETLKTNVEAFIKSNEGKFSLFGWVVRMFQ